MRRTMTLLWLFLKNWRVYRKRAFALAVDDALNGIRTGDYEPYMVDSMLDVPAETIVANPFGRFKEVNERLNDAG